VTGAVSDTGSRSQHGLLQRVAALAEVTAVFAATHVLYRAIKRFTLLGDWEAAAGTNFIPGVVMVAVSVCALLVRRWRFEPYGLDLRRWPRDLNLGLACGTVVIAFSAVALGVTGYRYDPSRPPDPHGPPQLMRTLGAPAIGLLALLVLLALFRGVRGRRHTPPAVSVAVLVALLAVPPLLAAYLHQPAVWPAELWNFFGAGFGEEVFFRGYIQSRVDAGFGRPWRVLGCAVGPGLIVSSLLFGLIHVLNTFDYFGGRWDFGWWYGLGATIEGLLYGYLRARTGSVWAGAVTHGMVDAYTTIPGLLRGQ
jgi:membrane protease YdiL (CAAX protease family)